MTPRIDMRRALAVALRRTFPLPPAPPAASRLGAMIVRLARR